MGKRKRSDDTGNEKGKKRARTSPDEQVVCETCGESVPQASMREHESTHRRRIVRYPTPIRCPFEGCPYVAATKNPTQSMKDHSSKHSESKEWKCDLCGRMYKYRSSWETHQTKKHGREGRSGPTTLTRSHVHPEPPSFDIPSPICWTRPTPNPSHNSHFPHPRSDTLPPPPFLVPSQNRASLADDHAGAPTRRPAPVHSTSPPLFLPHMRPDTMDHLEMSDWPTAGNSSSRQISHYYPRVVNPRGPFQPPPGPPPPSYHYPPPPYPPPVSHSEIPDMGAWSSMVHHQVHHPAPSGAPPEHQTPYEAPWLDHIPPHASYRTPNESVPYADPFSFPQPGGGGYPVENPYLTLSLEGEYGFHEDLDPGLSFAPNMGNEGGGDPGPSTFAHWSEYLNNECGIDEGGDEIDHAEGGPWLDHGPGG
ncbi:hypothetical protein SISSUDRAFT_1062970 [Sistotremastrum suecicum HHB10207 ss-3]|uniref:C2H2-type domain-containing protein n=1 Tax=Sistotremastrum suecicum HHB10207 ss-3 TaxID=1314776 RepID=A0A166CAE4_9AGAM|nr:hypothetical protein SISSUDRAFT_1062970 [Sistotremastrum suecicum HHB10207 ss-3]